MTNTTTNKMTIGKMEIELRALTVEQAQKELESQLNWNKELTVEKNYRKLANMIVREDNKIFNEINQQEVKSIEIHVEWKKSQTWGNTPHAQAFITYKDGTTKWTKNYSTSGCGYDKLSTVVSNIFDDYLKYKLYKEYDENVKVPYGLHKKEFKYYDGGIGINCYNAISNYIGGNFETLRATKNTDTFLYTDNN